MARSCLFFAAAIGRKGSTETPGAPWSREVAQCRAIPPGSRAIHRCRAPSPVGGRGAKASGDLYGRVVVDGMASFLLAAAVSLRGRNTLADCPLCQLISGRRRRLSGRPELRNRQPHRRPMEFAMTVGVGEGEILKTCLLRSAEAGDWLEVEVGPMDCNGKCVLEYFIMAILGQNQ